MRLVILDVYTAASEWAAKYVKKRIHDFKPGPENLFTMGLPTGKYNALIILFTANNVSPPCIYFGAIIIMTSIGTRSAFFFNESRRTKVPKLYSKESMSSGTF